MKKSGRTFITVDSVAAYHELVRLPKPEHPLMTIVDFSKVNYTNPDPGTTVVLNLYCISLKLGSDCVLRYGPHTYDFTEGVLSFIKPGQAVNVMRASENVKQGFMLTFHPDFISPTKLANDINKYDFFDYSVNEALFVSEKERQHIQQIMSGIEREYHTNIDSFSHEAIIAYIELLLVYANRYYHRQFITRKPKSDQLLLQFEKLLNHYYTEDKAVDQGLPTVQYLADRLNMSPNYLSAMLRVSTGKSAQGHIQDKVIEVAKNLLGTSSLTVAEIAYALGFERPQSLNKLFKRKTKISPLEYRTSLN